MLTYMKQRVNIANTIFRFSSFYFFFDGSMDRLTHLTTEKHIYLFHIRSDDKILSGFCFGLSCSVFLVDKMRFENTEFYPIINIKYIH